MQIPNHYVVHLKLIQYCMSIMCCAKLLQSCPTLSNPVDHSLGSPLSMGFSRQEYWSGLPCPPPGHLPNPGIKFMSLMSLALEGGFFTTSTNREARMSVIPQFKMMSRQLEKRRGRWGRRLGWLRMVQGQDETGVERSLPDMLLT